MTLILDKRIQWWKFWCGGRGLFSNL